VRGGAGQPGGAGNCCFPFQYLKGWGACGKSPVVVLNRRPQWASKTSPWSSSRRTPGSSVLVVARGRRWVPAFAGTTVRGMGLFGGVGVTLRDGSGDMSLLLSVFRPRWSLESVVVFAAGAWL
jgi:hypothetical protein